MGFAPRIHTDIICWTHGKEEKEEKTEENVLCKDVSSPRGRVSSPITRSSGMASIARIFSRPVAKPYRSHQLKHEKPYINDRGRVDFAPGDVENPRNWSRLRRAYVTVVCVLLVVNATFASSAPSGCLPVSHAPVWQSTARAEPCADGASSSLPIPTPRRQSIAGSFNISTEAAGLTITLFLLGYCAGPLVFAPLSESYGRRAVFLATFALYLASTFLCAFAPSFGGLLAGRFLAGTFVSAPLSNSPGVLADVWGPRERGNAMAAFSCMVWAGPAAGPVISGFLQLTKGDAAWRWTFYVLLMLGAASSLLLLTLPETYAPVLLRRKAAIEDDGAGRPGLVASYKVALTRPWTILLDPISFLVALYLSVVYLLLYMLFAIYPIVFQQRRGWNAGVGELPLVGTVVGALLAGAIMVWDTRRQARAGRALTPEDRLATAMPGGVVFAASMFWLAWTGESDAVHWAAPTLAGVFLSGAMVLVFVSFLNYLVDTYLEYAASAVAANTVCRSACGAAAPLFTDPMFAALGIGGGGSLIGGVGALLAVIPFVFYRYGEGIRRRSKFAPTQARAEAGRDDEEMQQQRSEGSTENGTRVADATASKQHDCVDAEH